MELIKFSYAYYKKEFWKGLVYFAMLIIVVALELFIPKLFSFFVDYFFLPDTSLIPPFDFIMGSDEFFIFLISALICTWVLIIFLKYISSYFVEKFSGNITNQIRMDLVKSHFAGNCCDVGNSFIVHKQDCEAVSKAYLKVFPVIISQIFSIIFAILFIGNIKLALLFLPFANIILIAFIMYIFFLVIKKLLKISRQEKSKLYYTLLNQFEKIKNFKNNIIYKDIILQEEKNIEASKKLSKTKIRFTFIINLLRAISYIVAVCVGGYLSIISEISVGDFLAYIAFVVSIFESTVSVFYKVIELGEEFIHIEKVKKYLEFGGENGI